MRPIRTLVVAVASVALTASVGAVAGTAQAAPAPRPAAVTPYMTPPPTGYHYVSLATGLATMRGKYYGGNAWTGYGRATINGFTRDAAGKYHRTLTMAYTGNTTIANGIKTGPNVGPEAIHPGPIMGPNSWYNPGSWDWGHILGVTWSFLWNDCLKGAVGGDVGAVGTQLATELLIKGGLAITWQGYAAVAIGGCMANLAVAGLGG